MPLNSKMFGQLSIKRKVVVKMDTTNTRLNIHAVTDTGSSGTIYCACNNAIRCGYCAKETVFANHTKSTPTAYDSPTKMLTYTRFIRYYCMQKYKLSL